MINALMLVAALVSQGDCAVAAEYSNSYTVVIQQPKLVWQIVNVAGGQQTRSHVNANIDGKTYVVPVINGRLPVITHFVSTTEDRLVLDFGQDYPYTVAYKGGVVYDKRLVANHKKMGPSAVKNYNQAGPQNAQKKSGPSGLKTPDALAKKAKLDDSTLPSPVDNPTRPSDKEVDDLFKQ
jgi:hypothetical protein